MDNWLELRGRKEIKYFFGIYRDYVKKILIAQLALTVDDLSCEMLAVPGLITFYQKSRKAAIQNGKMLAKENGCKHIEYNLEKYRINKVK